MMPLEKKVAKLSSNGMHQGSAWLISATHAITALHCIRGDDKIIRPLLTLSFFGYVQVIDVTLDDFNVELDIAILRLPPNLPSLDDRILYLSRRVCARNDNCLMRGHPALTLEDSPDGRDVRATIINPTAQRTNRRVIELDQNTISPTALPNGSGTTYLQGISGGPITIDIAGEEEAVVGLIIDESMYGNRQEAVSIHDIASKFQVIATALHNSPHIIKNDGRVWITQGENEQEIKWSATFSPLESHRLWENSSNPKYIRCTVKPIYLGPAKTALFRMAAYAGPINVDVIEAAEWTTDINNIEAARQPINYPIINNIIDSNDIPPARWQTLTRDQLSTNIHDALNKHILMQIHNKLYDSLARGMQPNCGCSAIEPRLRAAMWTQWENWHSNLKNNSQLLEIFFVRIFSTDAETNGDDILISLGNCPTVIDQFYRATIFALALSASGINTLPAQNKIGNLSINNQNGHACGIEIQNQTGKLLSRIALIIDWKAEVVVLPYLQSKLYTLFEIAPSMIRREGALGVPLSHLPPLAITSDDEFLSALENGTSAVLAYYNQRIQERSVGHTASVVQPLTGVLNA